MMKGVRLFAKDQVRGIGLSLLQVIWVWLVLVLEVKFHRSIEVP